MDNRDEDLKDDAVTQVCGILAMAGCAVSLVADMAGVALADSIGFASDTISDLAAGPYDRVGDAGLYAFVVAVLAAALGLARWHVAGWDWTAGKVLLVLIAADVTAISAYEAYNRPGGGPDLHMYFVYFLGGAFPLMVWLKSGGFGKLHGWLKRALRIYALAWAAAGPVLFAVPTGWDGLYERTLALTMMGWFALAGWLLWANTQGRRARAAKGRR